MAKVRELLKHSLIYGGGTSIGKVASLVLLPIYTRYLTPADYGILALLLATRGIARFIGWLGQGPAMVREIIYEESDARKVTSTVLFALLGIGFVLYALLVFLSPSLSMLLFGSGEYQDTLRLLFVAGFLGTPTIVALSLLRVRNKSILYSSLSLGNLILDLTLKIIYVAYLRQGVHGIIIADFITNLVFFGIYCLALLSELRFIFSFRLLGKMLAYGLPLVPASFCSLFMTSADRYFLQYFSTTAEVGLYSLGYTLGMAVLIPVNAVQTAWPPHLFDVAREPNAEIQLSVRLTYYVYVISFLALAISVLAPELLVILGQPNFYKAADVVPLIVLSYVFFGIRFMTNSALLTQGKTKYVAAVILTAALINCFLNFLLIPNHGMMGAAWATLISYLFLVISQLYLNLKLWYIPYEYKRLLKIIIVSGAIFWICQKLPISNIYYSISLKSFLLAIYPVLLLLLGFYKTEEFLFIRRIFNFIGPKTSDEDKENKDQRNVEENSFRDIEKNLD